MDFSDLSRLWWFVAVPVAIWLARPPEPRRSVPTAHLAQWRAAIAATGRRPVRFPWLRLLLWIIAASALVLAAAGPRISADVGPRRLVILLDRSASMGHGDTWSRARGALERVLDATPPDVGVSILECGRTLRRLEADTRTGLLALVSDAPLSAAGQVDVAALAAAVETDDVAVCTITDGRGVATPRVGALVPVGEGGANRGITACSIVDAWPDDGVRVTGDVAEFGRFDVPARVTVRIDGTEVATTELRFDGGTASFRFELARMRGGPLVIQLDGSDSLVVDDRVEFELPKPPAPNIAMISADGSSHGVLAASAATLASLSGGRVLDAGAERAGFVLVEGGSIADLPPRATTFGTVIGPSRHPARERPIVSDWDRTDPLLEGLDLSELRIRRALGVGDVPRGEVLIEGVDGPLAVAVPTERGARAVCFAFRLTDSNLGLLAAFPQLLSRSFRASFGSLEPPRPAPTNLLSVLESDPAVPAAVARPLPTFGSSGTSLVVPMILVALLALALRIHV